MTDRSVVRLPPGVRAPFDVYINGVPQQEGTDYRLREGALIFSRALAQEGKVSAWRWLIGAFGVGTYRRHDGVDVRYTTEDGRPMVAENLPVETSATG